MSIKEKIIGFFVKSPEPIKLEYYEPKVPTNLVSAIHSLKEGSEFKAVDNRKGALIHVSSDNKGYTCSIDYQSWFECREKLYSIAKKQEVSTREEAVEFYKPFGLGQEVTFLKD